MSTRNDDPTAASRPFDRARDGFTAAKAPRCSCSRRTRSREGTSTRKASGYVLQRRAPHDRAASRRLGAVMGGALKDAHVEPTEIGAVNAHGSSTPLNDPTETRDSYPAFGDRASADPRVQLVDTSPHRASGAMEVGDPRCVTEQEWLPPTLNRHPATAATSITSLGRAVTLADYIPDADKAVCFVEPPRLLRRVAARAGTPVRRLIRAVLVPVTTVVGAEHERLPQPTQLLPACRSRGVRRCASLDRRSRSPGRWERWPSWRCECRHRARRSRRPRLRPTSDYRNVSAASRRRAGCGSR